MADPTIELRGELNALLRLTQTEAVIAQIRRAQARDEAIEKELAQNADNCEDRARRLTQAIRDLGGVPDIFGAAIGRAAAVAKAQAEQGQPLAEALLGDLALERQLLDRARFARVLAETADERKVVRLMERLETAHSATVEWINTRLAEHAVGGPTAIRPTPVQAAVGVSRRVATFPARQAVDSLNRSIVAFGEFQEQVEESVTTTVDRVRRVADAVGEAWTAGRDAMLERGEAVANAEGAGRTAKALHRGRVELGALNADELPIKRYQDLNVTTVVNRLQRLTDAEEIRSVLTYEQATKNRKGVVSAAQAQLEEVANQVAAGASS
jgi:bacterioferritin (cytochrome b1)